MWCFKGHEGLCIYILPNQKKSFGKSQNDIELHGDATISEFHAVISVKSIRESNMEYKCVINNISKYGTVIIRDEIMKKLSANDKFILRSGDIVQFGQKYTFIALCFTFVIVKSGLNEEDTAKLRDIVDYLGGRLSETWDNSCTYLTAAKSVLFTTKLVCALASAKPIVTIGYWKAVIIAIKESRELPKIEDFLPEVKEKWLQVCSKLFLPDDKRKTLFEGLSFVHFCAKQHFTYALLITTAGGKSCVYPTKQALNPLDLTARNAIVVQQPANDSSQLTQVIAVDYPIIYQKLQAVKRRMVSDTEIPLAILHCATTMYCNPKFDFATFVNLETQVFASSDTIIIEDTQDNDNAVKRHIEKHIIPETYNSQNNENVSKETYFSYENEEVVMKDKQNVDDGENKHLIIPETCDSQNNEHISKKILFFDKDEQSDIFSKDDIGIKIQSDKNNIKDIHFLNENRQHNIFNNNKNNIVSNIVTKQFNKQSQIIPESCNLEENTNNYIFSDNSNNKQAHIIFDTCKFNEKNISNVAPEKVENVKLHEMDIFIENNTMLVKKYKEDILEENKYKLQLRNVFMNKNSNSKFVNSNLNYKENLILENNNLNVINDKFKNVGEESSKNSKIPEIVLIEEIDSSEMHNAQQGKKKNTLRKHRFTVEEPQNLYKKEEKLILVGKAERNKNIKENKIQKEDNGKKEPQRLETNWYERYLNKEFTNEILRKDIPFGKRFAKIVVKSRSTNQMVPYDYSIG